MDTKLFTHIPHPHEHHNVNRLHDDQLTLGNRLADKFAAVIGSWRFIIIQSIILAAWITLNSLAYTFHWDNYPYVLLNLALSFEAAFSAPIIMMSQNRQAVKDRIMTEETYKATIKEEHQTGQIVRHLGAQDEELLRQMAELLKQTPMLQEILDILKFQASAVTSTSAHPGAEPKQGQ